MQRRLPIIVLLLGAAGLVHGAEGDLDLSYNGTGKARAAFDLGGTESGKADLLVGLAVQPDGKAILFGSVNDDTGLRRVGLARMRANGSLDTDFSGDGKDNFAFGVSTPQAVALLDDGRIVAAFRAEFGSILLARRGANGAPDGYPGSNFDVIGFVLPGATTNDITALLPLSGGRLLAAGSYTTAANGSDFFVARLDANGVLDPGFGTSAGYTRVNFALDLASADVPRALARAADGRIAAVGTVSAGDREFGIVMLDANGQPIASFDADGRAVVDFDVGDVSDDRGSGACFLPSGHLVIGGNVTQPDNPDSLGLAKLTATGALAPDFQGSGRRIVNVLTFAGLACTPESKLLLVGTIESSSPTLAPSEAFVARYDEHGSNDNTFVGFGSAIPFGINAPGPTGGRSDVGIAVATDARGRIYAGFDAQFSGLDHDFAVARLSAAFLFANGFE